VGPDDRLLVDFAVGATFEGDQAVLALGGEVDALTAPEFAAFFEAMLNRGHRSVVLDLAALRFMDASGLEVIAQGAERLEAAGGNLTIRTPGPMVRQLLGITGFARLVRVEGEKSKGPESVGAGSHPMGGELARFTPVRSHDEVVDGALRLAVSLAHAAVGGADGVSVSLRRHGHLSTVAATDETIARMDANQYDTGEGPCIDASVEGHWFHTEHLEREVRWPAFTPRARALGINSILSSPLLVEEKPVGALNIYSLTPSAFSPRDQELAAAFATETSSILRGVGSDVDDERLLARFQSALRARELIAQAQGVLMERDGLAEDEAYSSLRRFSLMHNRPLQERAHDIVSSTHRDRPDFSADGQAVAGD
jgi:anti-anti-sigma factor